jgi:3,4-dihydroxy 2-butanone 4-phosphate synthase/GTP cyclohydrolase II
VADLKAQAAHYYATERLPFVTLSYAQSLDGSIANADGSPLRISGAASMALTHLLRAAHDAILVGVGTVLADDPQLTVRLVPGADPQPIILDSRLRTPPTARCLDNARPPWLATTSPDAMRAAPLIAAGAQVLTVAAEPNGQVALRPLLQQLAALGIGSIMVEGGATVLRNFLRAGLAQAAVITIAPIFVGGLPALSPSQDGAAFPQTLPRLVDPQSLLLGGDIICYGHFYP